MSHLKRHKMPPYWKISRKEKVYTVSPNPGAHPKSECIPLLIIVRDILKHAETGEEAKKIINRGNVLVDGIQRKDYAYPAGFMDIVSLKETGENFRIGMGPHGLELQPVPASEAGRKVCNVVKKYTGKGKLQYISLHDGRVVRLGKEASPYKQGDSVEIEIPGQKIISHIKLEKGADALIIRGKNMGTHGKIRDIRDRKFMTEKSTATIESEGREIETLKEYIMVTGRKKGEKK
jgi:small subunit ribosomal protein S4e